IGSTPLRRTKSSAAEDSQRKCQNSYRAADGVSRFPSFTTLQRCFNFECRNCQYPSKNFVNNFYEQFRRTENVQHRKDDGRPSVSGEVSERVGETFIPLLIPKLDEVLFEDRQFRHSNRKSL
ncbi:hypothetical protein AVEN_124620-1, partial [Araneus ventricosus]